ncbi:MAG: helix-turn-helix transcriptional regulator [Clostridiales bacterium]|nr:helix-turn-helix transcriptional regulator [Clostridiales bacterium]
MLPTAERLKYLREREGLTQGRLARAIGINVQTYKGYEEGRRDMPSAVLADLSRFYNVSTDYIVGIVDLPYSTASDCDETIECYYGFSEEDKRLVREIVRTIYRERGRKER